MTTPTSSEMRRWVLPAGGRGVDALQLQAAPVPRLLAGHVLVRVQAAALNFRDQLLLMGQYGPTDDDLVVLSDAAGVVEAVGDGVERWAVGDAVTTLYYPNWADGPLVDGLGVGPGTPGDPGMLAEYVVLPEHAVTASPSTLTAVEASTLTCAGLTAWTALNGDRPYDRRVAAGDHVLVLGSGGVSLLALELATSVGAAVWATSGDDGKLDRVRALGAVGAVNYRTDPNWGRAVFEMSGGIDRVVNAAGTSAIDQGIAALRAGGEIALMGFMDQAEHSPDFIALMTKAASIRGTRVGSAAAHADLARAVDEHDITPPISAVFPFDQAKDAYRAQTGADVFGKVVIEVTT